MSKLTTKQVINYLCSDMLFLYSYRAEQAQAYFNGLLADGVDLTDYGVDTGFDLASFDNVDTSEVNWATVQQVDYKWVLKEIMAGRNEDYREEQKRLSAGVF